MLRVTRLVCGALAENCYILRDDRRPGALIVDPGDDLPAIVAELGADKVTAILLTHGHFDHILAAAPLRSRYGAPIYIHPLDESMLRRPGDALMDMAPCALPFEPIEPDKTYPAGARFQLDLDGWRVEGFHTPGHTPGGVSLLLSDGAALFTGDTLFSYGYGRYDFPGGDVRALMASIRTLLALDGGLTVYSGHGDSDTMARVAARWR